MKCAIMQPTYMPWLGYFSMIDQVDVFVFLDDVQLTKRSWQVRNKLKSNDTELMLTIPVKSSEDKARIKINNADLDETSGWRESHLKSIKFNYSGSPYFTEVYTFIENLYSRPYTKLSEFNINFIKEICRKIGIDTTLINSSDIHTKFGTKDLMLASICVAVGADEYLAAIGSAKYIERYSPGGEIIKNSIDLYYQAYEHPIYFQKGNFVSHLGILDLLFNEGFRKSIDIIRSGRRENIHYMKYGDLLIEGVKNEN